MTVLDAVMNVVVVEGKNITGLKNTAADGGMMRGRHAAVYLPSFSINSVVRSRVSVGGP